MTVVDRLIAARGRAVDLGDLNLVAELDLLLARYGISVDDRTGGQEAATPQLAYETARPRRPGRPRKHP